MKIIGHRGAAGLALENTKEAFILARRNSVDAIELDVHATADNQLAVIHDSNTERIADQNVRVRSVTLRQLQTITLRNDEHILSLKEVLAWRRNYTPELIIELKDSRSAEPLLKLIKNEKNLIVASFRFNELRKIKHFRPDIPIYLLERTKPLDALQRAMSIQADGVGLNHWIINPYTYWLARRKNLHIYVYTVNYRLVAWFLGILYPRLDICTDFPDRFKQRPRK